MRACPFFQSRRDGCNGGASPRAGGIPGGLDAVFAVEDGGGQFLLVRFLRDEHAPALVLRSRPHTGVTSLLPWWQEGPRRRSRFRFPRGARPCSRPCDQRQGGTADNLVEVDVRRVANDDPEIRPVPTQLLQCSGDGGRRVCSSPQISVDAAKHAGVRAQNEGGMYPELSICHSPSFASGQQERFHRGDCRDSERFEASAPLLTPTRSQGEISHVYQLLDAGIIKVGAQAL